MPKIWAEDASSAVYRQSTDFSTCHVVFPAKVSSPPRVAMPLKIAALPLIFLVGAIADVDDMMEEQGSQSWWNLVPAIHKLELCLQLPGMHA